MKRFSRLNGTRAKIERAKHHINDLVTTFQFCRNDLKRVSIENDANTGGKIHRIHFNKVPLKILLIVGGAIHNLRSSLDHLVWQLVEANGNTPGIHTSFPIFKCADEYKTQAPRKIHGVAPSAEAIINAIKPYKGGNDQLWVIHDLDRIDKHRQMLIACGALTAVVIGSSIAKQDETLSRLPKQMLDRIDSHTPIPRPPGVLPASPKLFMLKDGAELPFSIIGISEPNNNLDAAVEIAFGEPEIIYGEPVIPFLHDLSNLVDSIVDKFAPFL